MVPPELRVLVAIAVLLYASASDVKSRRINDSGWKALMVSGVAFAAIDAISNKMTLVIFAISILVTAAILLPLHRLKRIGGGDVMMLLGLAAVLPKNPYASLSVFPVFTLSAFANAIFLTAALPIYFLALNLYRRDLTVERPSEVRFLFLGYKKKASEVTEHERVMKKVGDYAWVTPALPFLVALTLGAILSLVWGDIPSYIVLK